MKDSERTIPVVEEQLRVEKREVSTGRVRVETFTDVSSEMVGASLTSSLVEVRHVPIGRRIHKAPDIRVEGDVTIVPVLEEVLVIEKHLYLKEELHLIRRSETEVVEVPVELRTQRVEISRLNADQHKGGDNDDD